MRIGRWLYAMFLAGVFALATGALPVVTAAPRDGAAPSITEQVLYSFCSQSNCADGAETVLYSFCSQTNCADGASPHSPG